MAVAAKNVPAMQRQVQPLLDRVDAVEARLDAMLLPDVAQVCEAVSCPLVCTCRPQWEGGAFAEAEEQRLALLRQAVACGAAYVDLEQRAELSLRRELLSDLTGTAARMIISWHDFNETPPAEKLAAILTRQAESGAHIGKIVTMAHSVADVRRVLHLLELASALRFPLIAFCMGQAGRVSRIITLSLGGFMTYAAPDGEEGTAPGQLPVSELHRLLLALEWKK